MSSLTAKRFQANDMLAYGYKCGRDYLPVVLWKVCEMD